MSNSIHRLWLRAWNSPTITTWGSFIAQSLSLVLVLPLLLTRFSEAEIALYYILATIWSLLMVPDFGFAPTFIRVLSYAKGGKVLPPGPDDQDNAPGSGQLNRESAAAVVSTMVALYLAIGMVLFVLLAICGPFFLRNPTTEALPSRDVWICWSAVVINGTLMFYGQIFSNYLQGMNRVALYRRWDAIFAVGTVLVNFGILLAGLGIVELVVWVYTSGGLITLLRNRYLSLRIEEGLWKQLPRPRFDRAMLRYVWPASWRSGLGVFMGNGTLQGSSLVYAKFGPPGDVATYLFSLRILMVIHQFSRAPFYSRIPQLAAAYAAGARDELLRGIRRGMMISYWTYVPPVILAGLTAPVILGWMGSRTEFASPSLWALMGGAFLIDRFSAMHIQVYSLSNRILWHIVNGVTGILFVAAAVILFPSIGIYALPAGYLAATALFYAWYAPLHSCRMLNRPFITFESRLFFPPLMLMTLYMIFAFWMDFFHG